MSRRKAIENTRALSFLMRFASTGMILGVLIFDGWMVLGEMIAWTVAGVMCWMAASALESWCNAAEELLQSNKLKFYF